MATLIVNEDLKKHSVNKYNFKVLSLGDNSDEVFTSSLVNLSQEDETLKASPLEDTSYTSDDNPNRRESDIDSSSMSKNSKDALIESLMKKTDEMSSNFIKLQMKLEAKDEEHTIQIQNTKEKSYNEGLADGAKKAIEDSKADFEKGISQFSSSVTALEQSAKEFESALEGIKKELLVAAVDISQEVIKIELNENSSEIAKILGDTLISELQSASKITLKVNPKDHGAVSEHVGLLEHIQIVSDSAVSEGGVIAISDAGNIDSQISKRFQRVKKAALSE